MDQTTGSLIVCLGVGLAISLPVLIYLSLRHENVSTQAEILRNIIHNTRRSTQEEALEELSRRVRNLELKEEDKEIKGPGRGDEEK